jgi:hypothetical protein
LSTAKPASRRVDREDVLLWLFALTPVLAWIAAQQLSFLVTRSICATGQRWLLYLVMGVAFAAAAAAGTASWTKWKAIDSKRSVAVIPMYRRFLALGGVFLATICAVSILSLTIPAALHRVCD